MSNPTTAILQNFCHHYQTQIPELNDVKTRLEYMRQTNLSPSLQTDLIKLYDDIYPLLERALWSSDEFDNLLTVYQDLFREQEALIQNSDNDDRYDFILSIPIADRPEHLRGCLESIFQLCSQYNYGGKKHGFYAKVSVIVVEDSKEQAHIDRDIELAELYCQKGLRVYHYGQKEQYELMLKIPEALRRSVSSIIGEPATENFYHKGQAVTRNLSYLKALQLTTQDNFSGKEKTLFYLVDSDQQFRVNRTTMDGDQYVYGLNYFYYINRIFKTNDIAMLTGKLVCDPPVSPSVMSANFLDDVIAFLQQLTRYTPQASCQFHPRIKTKPDDAAYHDMAHLFGLGSGRKIYDYCCPIQSKHNHIDCLNTFAERINYFFFGEHLTRKTYFSYSTPFTDIAPARTIYPGNYITTFEGLKYIIPFGQLRLRMSGPTAGRLIQSEIQERFACVNLPMLHARTLQSDFKDEYRPGVEDNMEVIDLTDEFERQFFGDLMLFTVDRLAKSGVSIEDYNQQNIADTFNVIEQELLELYQNKHNNVIAKCQELTKLLNDDQQWWNQSEALVPAIRQLEQFIKNIRYNFNEQSNAYQHIQSKSHRQQKVAQMSETLLNYRHDRNAWDKMLKQFRP